MRVRALRDPVVAISSGDLSSNQECQDPGCSENTEIAEMLRTIVGPPQPSDMACRRPQCQ